MDKNKEIMFGQAGRLKVVAGMNKGADAVKPTLGAIGMSSMIEWKGLDPIEADDGVTILKNLKWKDPYEQMGLQKLRKAALRTSAEGGDGTATTTVLTQAFVAEALKELNNDSINSRDVVERLDAGLKAALTELAKIKRDVKPEDIERIALISSLDKEVATMISDIIKEVGIHGVVTVEKGSQLGYTKEVVKGARFDNGYISQYFINDFEQQRVVLENPYIALIDRRVSLGTQLKGIMDAVHTSGKKSILFIADDIDGLALASLIQSSKSVTIMDQNTKETKTGTYEVCAVKNPFNATPGRDFLQDMAALTGATIVSEEAGMRLDDAGLSVLGSAEKVIITKGNCTIIGGKGSQEAIKTRTDAIQGEIDSTTSEYQKVKLEERMAQLTGGIGVIRVGAYTDTDFNKMKYKFDNAINATQAALQEGIVAGGGAALMKVAIMVDEPMFKRALQAPLAQMATNAGMSWYEVTFAVKDAGPDTGYDFKAKKLVDMFEAGIIDPFKVTRLALESAVHIASTLVDKEVFIVDEEDDKTIQ